MRKVSYTKSIIGRKGHKYYKNNCNKEHLSKSINRENHTLIVTAIFRKIAQKLLDNKSGVYLKGFGYLCVMMYPKRITVRNGFDKEGNKHFNPHTNHYIYSPQWLQTESYQPYYPWTLDRTFSLTNIRKPLAQRLRAGKKYTIEYKLAKSL